MTVLSDTKIMFRLPDEWDEWDKYDKQAHWTEWGKDEISMYVICCKPTKWELDEEYKNEKTDTG